jgi:hypothetical protein
VQVTLGLGSHGLNHGRVQPEQTLIPEPAVETGFTYELSTAYNEWPTTLAFSLTTDSNAGNRQVSLTLEDPAGNFVAAVPVASTQAASLTYRYSFQSWLSNASTVVGGVVVSPLFNFLVPAGYQIVCAFSGGHAGDQISQIVYYRDRYSTGPDGYPQGGYNLEDLAAFYTETLNQG